MFYNMIINKVLIVFMKYLSIIMFSFYTSVSSAQNIVSNVGFESQLDGTSARFIMINIFNIFN